MNASRAPSPLEIDIAIEAEGWARVEGLDALVARAVEAGLAEAPLQPMTGAELSILMTNDARMREINRAWRGQDKPTNVLSFPAVPPDRIAASALLGDIALAWETVQAEAVAEKRTIDAHLSHLVIHGLLHLLGEDHETEAEAERMETREVAALARLGYASPYAELHDSDPSDGGASGDAAA
jgi:probable rRNA maturation factor